MKVLLVCSGNKSNGEFHFEQDRPFIYEQTKYLELSGIKFEFFFIKGKGLFGYLKNITKFRQAVKSETFDLVHAHSGPSGFVAVFQRIIPLIITFHGSDINQKKTRLISNFVSIMASYRIFVSSSLLKKLYLKPHNNYSIIPCGINLDTFYPIEKIEARKRLNMNETKAYVLFSSYFSNPMKNYLLAKRAMSFLPKAELVELKNKTRDEVNLLLNAVDVLLVTSPHEGSPQVIKEAMACNCPVVTTNVGDVKTILRETEHCYICDPNPEEIAEKLEFLLRSHVRTRGRESISGYENSVISNKIINIYRKYGDTD